MSQHRFDTKLITQESFIDRQTGAVNPRFITLQHITKTTLIPW